MAVSTNSMVTKPALGMLAAPMLANVEVRLWVAGEDWVRQINKAIGRILI